MKGKITHISCSSRRRRCPTAIRGRPSSSSAAAAGARAFFYATAPRRCPTTSPTCSRVSQSARLITRDDRLPSRATHNPAKDARARALASSARFFPRSRTCSRYTNTEYTAIIRYLIVISRHRGTPIAR